MLCIVVKLSDLTDFALDVYLRAKRRDKGGKLDFGTVQRRAHFHQQITIA